MSLCATTTTIHYTDSLDHDGSSSTLRPFSIAVSFLGRLPPNTHQLPLQISVSLPKEYAGFTSPVLTASTPSPPESIAIITLEEFKGDQETLSAFDRAAFLPLQSFDHNDGNRWASLAQDIENWLITVVIDPNTQEWVWGRDLFWMAFIAAYPTFPQGPWPFWDAKISVEGAFIQGWLDREESRVEKVSQGVEFEHSTDIRKDIWQQFCQTVCLYYP